MNITLPGSWARSVYAIWLCLILAFIPACASTPETPSQFAPSANDVTLQPGDVVRIAIWRHEDLSGSFTVYEDGTVTLPLLGERMVADVPLEELRRSLVEDYRKLLRNPSIEVVPLRNVLVLGSVNAPGPYEVNPTTTVLGAVALAQGPTSAGSVEKLRIQRGEEVLVDRVPPGATLASLNLRSGDQIIVGNRSWLTRNQSFVVSVILAIPSVIYTITRIGG